MAGQRVRLRDRQLPEQGRQDVAEGFGLIRADVDRDLRPHAGRRRHLAAIEQELPQRTRRDRQDAVIERPPERVLIALRSSRSKCTAA